jgi:hypothetical protein
MILPEDLPEAVLEKAESAGATMTAFHDSRCSEVQEAAHPERFRAGARQLYRSRQVAGPASQLSAPADPQFEHEAAAASKRQRNRIAAPSDK